MLRRYHTHLLLRFGSGATYLLASSACFGNGWISGVNAFRQTPDFFVTFAAIVSIEWLIVWRSCRTLGALGALWRVVLINIVSSLGGDVLFRLGWQPASPVVWKQAIPFFLLTIALELPLLIVLLRNSSHSAQKAGFVAILANVASYALLVTIDRPVREGWLRRLAESDRQIIQQWTNTQMLTEATGCIYGTESSGGLHRLRYFSFAEHRWHSIPNSPALHPNFWHVEGDLLAFLTYGEMDSFESVKLTTLPGCSTIRDLRLPPRACRCHGGWDVAIAPDRSKLAVLVPVSEIQGRLSGSTYWELGYACLLVVFNIATGESSVCPRKAIHSLCWMPDSKEVLFHSLPDGNLNEFEALSKDWKRKYVDGKPDNPFLHPPLFAYRPATGQVQQFHSLEWPQLAADAHKLLFRIGSNALGLMDAHGEQHAIPLGQIGRVLPTAVAPDARFALAPLILSPAAGYWGYPAIVDLNAPSKRYYFGPFLYRIVWARTPAGNDPKP